MKPITSVFAVALVVAAALAAAARAQTVLVRA
jgi:hypothetical protein